MWTLYGQHGPCIDISKSIFSKNIWTLRDMIGTIGTPYGQDIEWFPYGVHTVDPEFTWSIICPYMSIYRVHFNGMDIISTKGNFRLWSYFPCSKFNILCKIRNILHYRTALQMGHLETLGRTLLDLLQLFQKSCLCINVHSW